MGHPTKLLLMLAAILVTAAAAWWLAPRDSETATAAQAQGKSTSDAEQGKAGRGARQGGGQPAPVFVATAETKDVPIIVRGIGTVQAFNTVTVKSRVDGNIVKIAFVEGQFVHTGDLLMQVDPRPYQAQLEGSEATKIKDQANLENAQRDLARYASLLKNQLAATQQQYDTQRAQVAQLEATLNSDQAQIDAAKLNVTYSSITSRSMGSPGFASSISAISFKPGLRPRSSSSLRSSRFT